MSYIDLSVAAPHATPYDSEYPTRSTENYSHALHTVLKNMDDYGSWFLSDGCIATGHHVSLKTDVRTMIKVVFDYAAGAIETYRENGTPTLSEPTVAMLGGLSFQNALPFVAEKAVQLWINCYTMLYKIYYMWKTEDDPLLLKEKLQELLVAWPLTDTEITLNEEGGQTLKIVPAWKNIDI